MLILIAKALWFILPAYFANASPVVLGGGTPIDGGRNLPDGHRILGDGKTIRGFFFGLVAGTTVALIQKGIENLTEPLHADLTLGFLLALGALLGDLLASFVKRRFDVERGQPMPVLDQLDFVVGALLFGALLEVPDLKIIATILIITPIIHLSANFIAYITNLKSVAY